MSSSSPCKHCRKIQVCFFSPPQIFICQSVKDSCNELLFLFLRASPSETILLGSIGPDLVVGNRCSHLLNTIPARCVRYSQDSAVGRDPGGRPIPKPSFSNEQIASFGEKMTSQWLSQWLILSSLCLQLLSPL